MTQLISMNSGAEDLLSNVFGW